MKILFIGDVVSQPGCDFVRKKLPAFKREKQIDVVIANGENSAVGNGMLPHSADFLLDSGVDVITSGNHVFRRREIYDYLEEHPQVIRPANYPDSCPGKGYYLYDGGSFQLCVINLMGTVFLDSLESPFVTIERILKEAGTRCCFVDFHAEATGEKKALAYYLDGRVSCFAGTHTHVQTADEQILPQGTGYITDAGMTGPIDSVLGVNPQNIIERYLTCMPVRFEVLDSPCKMDAVLFEVDPKTGKCGKIERVCLV
ncbi:MAG: TIGR00282 family metallophosphoesterase [Massiliimalia sp.]